MTSQEKAVAQLADESAIRELVARFAEAANTNDVAAFRELWTEDGQWIIADPISERRVGVDDVATLLAKLLEGRDFFFHAAVPGPISIAGDEARVTCVCSEAARGPGETFYRNHAFCHDRLRRTRAGWRFARRRYAFVWLDTSPFSGNAIPQAVDPQD